MANSEAQDGHKPFILSIYCFLKRKLSSWSPTTFLLAKNFKKSNVTIKKVITERAGVAASPIIAMNQARSGLALEYVLEELQEKMLGIADSLQQESFCIKTTSDWTSVIV